MATCDELRANLANLQQQLSNYQSAELNYSTSVALLKVQILSQDPGAPVPLDASSAAARMAYLATNGGSGTLISMYGMLLGYLAMLTSIQAAISVTQASIGSVQAQMQAGGC